MQRFISESIFVLYTRARPPGDALWCMDPWVRKFYYINGFYWYRLISKWSRDPWGTLLLEWKKEMKKGKIESMANVWGVTGGGIMWALKQVMTLNHKLLLIYKPYTTSRGPLAERNFVLEQKVSIPYGRWPKNGRSGLWWFFLVFSNFNAKVSVSHRASFKKRFSQDHLK